MLYFELVQFMSSKTESVDSIVARRRYKMGWIIWTVVWFTILSLIGIVALIFLIKPKWWTGDEEEQGTVRGVCVAIVVTTIVVFGLWTGISTLVRSIHQVPAGHVGVVYTFGDITGQTDEGLVLVWPWQSLVKANTQVQTLCFADRPETCPDGAHLVGEGLDSFSTETQNVFIDAVLRIKVDPGDVQGLYRNVGKAYVNKLIPGSIAQVFKDETVDYKAVDIAPNRETIRANVEVAITHELQRFSINVDALLIENIAFEPSFEAAILAKQNATQEALKEQELIKAKEAMAKQVAATAQGEADRLRITAQGQADANRLIADSLTPLLVQFQAMQRLADNVQIALIPSGQGIIIDPAQLLKSPSPTPATP